MSKVVGNTFHIEVEADGKCTNCGKVAELRPYGKGGANICYCCGMKDMETTKTMMEKRISDVDVVVVGKL